MSPSDAEPSLDSLREEIDRIDDRLLDALKARFAAVEHIGAVKKRSGLASLPFRPAREAQILRRLITRNDGALDPAMLVRIWRELIAAATRRQADFRVTVLDPDGDGLFTHMAREHFSTLTHLTVVQRSQQAFTSLVRGECAVAVLPLPQEGDSWWIGLPRIGTDKLHAVARLPFAPHFQPLHEALVFAALAPEPSGDDLSLLTIESAMGSGRARLIGLLEDAGLPVRWSLIERHAGFDHANCLLEVEGFVTDGDTRLVELTREEGVFSIHSLGAYARPCPPTEDGL
ncbi:MAG: chorismate mutase [Geminicoccaceae bacterium]